MVPQNLPSDKGKNVPQEHEELPKPSLTTAHVNEWLEFTLKNPSQARELRDTNWVALLNKKFATTKEQAENLSLIPAEYVKELQRATGMVVDYGGTIRMERESEHSAGEIFVRPNPISPEVASFSVGIFHCTFDANFRNWRCGWGPG